MQVAVKVHRDLCYIKTMKVYIVQEIDGDEVPNAKVYESIKGAVDYAQDIVEYVNLTDEAGEEIDIYAWAGEEGIDFYDNEGAIVMRLYSTEVK